MWRVCYHLQLLHPQLFATLERDALLLGLLQRVVPHRGAEADDHVHPAGTQTHRHAQLASADPLNRGGIKRKNSADGLFLDVWTQAEDVLLAGDLELVGESEVLHLNLNEKTFNFVYYITFLLLIPRK